MARQGPYSGTFAVYHTFHTAEASAANGTAISCAGLAGVGVQLEGIVGETITFEGTIDGSTWYGVQAVNRNDGSVGTTATADGLYFADVAGMDQFRARISTADSGSVTATGYGVTVTGGAMADIDIAGAEAATIADGADVAQGTTTDAAAASDSAEDTTARTQTALLKGLKNILLLLNTKFVTGTDIGDVDVLSIAAGETHIGEVGGSSITISQTPTITAGAYTANDACGGLLTFANAARTSGGTGVIYKVVIIDDALQDCHFDLVLFDRTFTAMSDNAAWSPSDADNQNCLGSIPILASNYCDGDDNSVATVRNVGFGFTANATSIFGQLVARDADTFAATDDITVKLFIMRD